MRASEYTPIGITVNKSEAKMVVKNENYRKYPKDSIVYSRNFLGVPTNNNAPKTSMIVKFTSFINKVLS